jgi:glutathionyl-hydroquinone reductase
MGLLIDGRWHDRWYDTKGSGGRFVRSEAPFRNWVTADGSPGPSGEGGFAAVAPGATISTCRWPAPGRTAR